VNLISRLMLHIDEAHQCACYYGLPHNAVRDFEVFHVQDSVGGKVGCVLPSGRSNNRIMVPSLPARAARSQGTIGQLSYSNFVRCEGSRYELYY
jgi:hypothetical protein